MKEAQRRETWRIYIADAIFYRDRNMGWSKRYTEVLTMSPAEQKSADEVIEEVFDKGGLRFKEDGRDSV